MVCDDHEWSPQDWALYEEQQRQKKLGGAEKGKRKVGLPRFPRGGGWGGWGGLRPILGCSIVFDLVLRPPAACSPFGGSSGEPGCESSRLYRGGGRRSGVVADGMK